MAESDRDRIYQLAEPWVVLAASNLITAAATGNFLPLSLLKAPIQVKGKCENRLGRAAMPSWFPLKEACFEAPEGAIYCKVKDLPLKQSSQPVGGDALQATFDLSPLPFADKIRSFTLTYSPWFRFLSEPIAFDAAGKMAQYVANCFRFLFIREGFEAVMEGTGDVRRVVTTAGVRVEFSGMAALRSVGISDGVAESRFDLEANRIEIDSRMFPAAHEAGHAMLQTSDRLMNMEVKEVGHRLVLAAAGDASRV